MLDCRRPFFLSARIHKAGRATAAPGHTASALVRSHIRARISRIRRRRRRIVHAIVPSFSSESRLLHEVTAAAAASLSSLCRARPPSVRGGSRGQPRRARAPAFFVTTPLAKAARAAT